MIVKIENFDHNGRAIVHIGEKVTFIENALPGEIVEIRLTKEHKKYNEGETIKIIEKSPKRTEPLCPYYKECGGCDTMHMTYEYELNFKKDKVKNILQKYSNILIEPEIIKSNTRFNYRNKITLHEKNGKIGYMKKSSNDIIEIENCPLVMESINKYIKENKNKTVKQLIVRTNDKKEIISSYNNKTLIMKINDLEFEIDINSFFQVNNYISSCIFNFINQNMSECSICLDLYGGVGTLAALASKKSKFVYSIEINPYSHKNSLKNLKINNINNIKCILGKVEEKINEIKDNIDTIITDPPRSGMDKKTIDIINNKKPKEIIYMSCNPMTLARDLNLLKEKYNIKKLTIFDMFPNTLHVECVCVMSRR